MTRWSAQVPLTAEVEAVAAPVHPKGEVYESWDVKAWFAGEYDYCCY